LVVFGHLGSGKTWLAQTLFGAKKPYRARIGGEERRIASTRQAARFGIALVPEERGKQGIWKRQDVRTHLSLGFRWFISRSRETAYSRGIMEAFDIRPSDPSYPAGALSGGNQQKVAIAKWFLNTPKVAIFDEPMKGIDVAAKETVFRMIEDLAGQGASVVYLTSEPDDALRIADRIMVLSRNRIAAELEGAEATAGKLFQAAEEEELDVGNA
jgi:simple sugar transport system ATP-binding protein